MAPHQASRTDARERYAEMLAAVNTEEGLGQLLHLAFIRFRQTMAGQPGYEEPKAWPDLWPDERLAYVGAAGVLLTTYEVRPRTRPGGTFNQMTAARTAEDERPHAAPRMDRGRTVPEYQVIKQAWASHLDRLLAQRAWSDEELRRELLRLTGHAPSKGTVNRMKHGWWDSHRQQLEA